LEGSEVAVWGEKEKKSGRDKVGGRLGTTTDGPSLQRFDSC
jgi:hypothetical protein